MEEDCIGDILLASASDEKSSIWANADVCEADGVPGTGDFFGAMLPRCGFGDFAYDLNFEGLENGIGLRWRRAGDGLGLRLRIKA
jgi:hypothetical protein